ncbi:MFS transporter [Sphingomonas sp.]|uniref:MFS transporter n=1 Tax=Sphingomonas sp. TaxID=28214 RepID=UPI003D6C8887
MQPCIPVARLVDGGNCRTVITVALIVWSGATALCGMAQNFWRLTFTRFGVGAGEAGSIPPAQSLIADYFSVEQRARALALFMSSATVGYLLGFVAGSQISPIMGSVGLRYALMLVTLVLLPTAWFFIGRQQR